MLPLTTYRGAARCGWAWAFCLLLMRLDVGAVRCIFVFNHAPAALSLMRAAPSRFTTEKEHHAHHPRLRRGRGTELARALVDHQKKVRLVSRNPKAVNPTDELCQADLLDPAQVDRAVKGSEVCYLTIGLPYAASVWKVQWPALMKNVIDACARHGAKLVFFSNVYSIGGDRRGGLTEDSPISPTSRKGGVPRRVSSGCCLTPRTKDGCRRSSLGHRTYGPVKQTSALMIMMYSNQSAGKKAQWFCNADLVHTMGYTPELALGTALLGIAGDTYNQILESACLLRGIDREAMGRVVRRIPKADPAVQVIPAWGVNVLGLFMPVLRESAEMLYQYDRAYVVDSSKFNKRFGYVPKKNEEGVRETLLALGHQV